MKTLLENFNKLKQLDKIEYMLRLNSINKKYNFGLSFVVLSFIFIYIGFMILTLITGYNAFGIDFTILLIKRFLFILRLLGVCLGIGIVIDIFSVVQNLKHKRELYIEFFKIEPKNKK